VNDLTEAFRDLTAMISSERDARRRDTAAIVARMQAADDRFERFEGALLDSLGRFKDAHVDLERRVSDLEAWRREQAG